jgi:hypothetical protein
MKQKTLNFFYQKFGKEITERLLDKDLVLDRGKISIHKEKDLSGTHPTVSVQMEKLIELGCLSKEDFENQNIKGWAFDFPGWIGALNVDKPSFKDIMIIGLEPHVDNNDFQIVYELADRTRKPTFTVRNNEIFCDGSSKPHVMWSNAVKILSSDNQYTEIFTNNNQEVLYEVLNKIYITDLCHFAPMGNANKIKNLKWKGSNGIRTKTAEKFLLDEIRLINPKLIIAHGNDVINTLRSFLNTEESHWISGYNELNHNRKVSGLKYLPWTAKLTFCNCNFLAVPHLASGIPQAANFYRNHIDELKKYLKDINFVP